MTAVYISMMADVFTQLQLEPYTWGQINDGVVIEKIICSVLVASVRSKHEQ